MNETGNILVISEGHPAFDLDESVLGAHYLTKGYRTILNEDAIGFLGIRERENGDGKLYHYAENDYLLELPPRENKSGPGVYPPQAIANMGEYIAWFKPEMIHVHVKGRFELIELAKQLAPDSKLLATIHSIGELCPHRGKMPYQQSYRICNKMDKVRCQACIGDDIWEQHWLHKRSLLHYLKCADYVVTPTNFLQNVYLAHGANPDNILTIHNPTRRHFPQIMDHSPSCNRFGYIGDISADGGIETVFQAMRSVPPKIRQGMILEIHGTNLHNQPEEFRKNMEMYCQEFAGDGFLRWCEPYHPDDAEEILSDLDWVLLPSSAWHFETSILQQIAACKRPLIAADCGCISEFVQNGKNGILVKSNKPLALAEAMQTSIGNSELWEKFTRRLDIVPTPEYVAKEHLELAYGLDDPWGD